jgi:hypothetical protein
MSLQHKLRRGLLATIAAMACMAAQAQSVTMTFDDIAGLNSTASAYGVQFQHSNNTHFILNGPTYIPGYTAGRALAYYALSGYTETLSLAPGVQGTFALHSLDLAGFYNFIPGETLSIQITGQRANGSVVTANQSFSVTQGQVSSYGPAVFSEFTGLQSLRFSGVGGNNARYVGVDNMAITITPVPEPETLALLLGGLALLGAVVRRRKQA